MAAQATAITNIIEPTLWSKYLLELTTEKSLLVQAGIAASDPALEAAASQGGRTVEMPMWDDLPHDLGTSTRSKVVTDTDTAITPAGLTTDYDLAVKHFRAQSFQVAPIINYVTGEDAAQVVLTRFAKWWMKEEQRLLLKTLTGVFADSTVATNLSNDISIETTSTDPANLISSAAIENTRFLLGDAFEKFTAIIMHSTPFQRLRLLNLIDFDKSSEQNAVPIATYQGLRVLVDDGMTKTAGSGSGFKYSSFLFGQGAIGRVDVPMKDGDPNIEVVRDPLKGTGAGQVDIVTRRYFLLHPRGIKYTGSLSGVVSPSDTDLSTDNWDQVWLTKNIRIARLVTNG